MTITLQKANLWKRISAWLFDAVLTFCLMLGVAIGVSYMLDYDSKVAVIKDVRSDIETQFEFDKYELSFDISEEEYEKLDDAKKQIYDEANKAFLQDGRTVVALRELLILVLCNVAVSLLVADLVIYFVIPLLFKNGQTLGKKCFGLGVVRSNCTKVTPPVLLVRALVGRYAMETIVPLTIAGMMLLGILGIVGTITLLLLFMLEIVVMIKTSTNSCVHDLLTDTVVVDTSSQMIFENKDALYEYVRAEEAKKAAEAEQDRPVATGVFAPKHTDDQDDFIA